MKTILRAVALTAALAAAPLAAHAAGAAKHPEPQAWSFDGPLGSYDRGAVQRGFVVYKQVCSSCHGMKMLSYRNLGEAGGPFQAVAPAKWQERGKEPKIGAPGHGLELVYAIDNPYVKAIAAQYEVTEIDLNTGDEITRPARPSDKFVSPFANDGTARAANGGALPPDLSVIAKAREGGATYIHALLTGYVDPPAGVTLMPGMNYNAYYPGHQIGMAAPLTGDGQVEYADRTKPTIDQMARDVSSFLAWTAEPEMEERKAMGVKILIFLAVLGGLAYSVKRKIWAHAH
jgi:ubiquinol-cytochrome c reductase cytochrome c1 subunit